MNTRQIRSLDLQKAVVLIPGGILEEHGYADEAYARELANAIVTRPGWTVVMFPQSLWSASEMMYGVTSQAELPTP